MMERLRFGTFLLFLAICMTGQSGYQAMPTVPYTTISGTAAVTVLNYPGTFCGIYSPSVQVNALSCYDNASAASGTLVYAKVVPVALNDINNIGIQMKSGLTCQQSLGITGTEFVLAH